MKSYKLYLYFIILILVSCNKNKTFSEIEKDKRLINNFIEEVFLEGNNSDFIEIEQLTKSSKQDSNKIPKKELDSLIRSILRKEEKVFNDYLDIYDKSQLDKIKILEIINLSIMSFKETNSLVTGNIHKIIHYTEVDKYYKVKSSKIYSELEYDKLDDVYFTFFENDSDWVGLFVVENGKIISFFPHLVFGVGPTVPFLLNEKPE